MRRWLVATLLLSATSWAGAGHARAQQPHSARADTARADTAVFRIEGIRVLAHRAVTTVGGAGAVQVTMDSLSLPAAPTVEEVLREVPAVHVRRNSRGEAELSVRGSESRQVAVLVDGVPITLTWDARTDLSVLPAMALHEATVVRGLSSVLHGPNVLGGVVEMNIARGLQLPTRTSAQATAGVDGVGGYGTAASVTVPWQGGGGWVLRAGGGWRDSPGVSLPTGVTEPVPVDDGLRLNTDVRSANGFMALRHRRDDGGWFALSTTAFRAERGIAGELDVRTPRLWRYPHMDRTIAVASAGTGRRGTPLGRGEVEASVGLDRGRTEIESYATRAYDAVVGREEGDARTLTVRVLAEHTLGSRGEVRSSVTWSDIQQDVVVDGVASAYQQKLASAALESIWSVYEGSDGPLRALRVTAGGALDRGDTPRTGGLPSLGVVEDWGARAGMTALVGKGETLLHAGLSRRGRFPALREMYSEALARFEPNPELRPERLVALEGGVTTRLARGEVQVVGFRQEMDGAIRRITLPNRKRKRVNADELRSHGVEILLAQTLDAVDFGGDLTLRSVRLVDPANPVSREAENLPEVAAGAYLRFPLPLGASATTEARYTGSQFCQHPDTGADVRLGAGTVLSAGLTRSWGLGASALGAFSGVEARVSGDNLGDTALYDQCGLPRPGRLLSFQIRLF